MRQTLPRAASARKGPDKLEERRRRWARSALEGCADAVSGAGQGGRNEALNGAALRVGRIVAAGLLDAQDAQDALLQAASLAGLPGREARTTLRSGFRAGLRAGPAELPRELIEGFRSPAPRAVRLVADLELPPPPAAEVAELWDRCRPVWDDEAQRAALQARAIDPAAATDEDLVRVLPPAGPLPSWARSAAGTWAETGHRLIFPVYGAAGELRGIFARTFRQDLPPGQPKGINARGYTTRGGVFADGTGRALLEGARPAWWDGRAIVCEGAPDWLSAALLLGDGAETRPAVFGYCNGYWSRELGARVPEGARVLIWAHNDEAGADMARKVAATMPQCTVAILEKR